MTKFGVGTLLCFAFVVIGFTSATELQYDFNDVNLVDEYIYEDGVKININDLVDVNIHVIQALLKRVDPLKLLRIPLLNKGSLSNGKLNHLSQIYRPNNCTLEYNNKVLTADLHMGWRDLNIHYDYDFKLWLIQRYGTVSGGTDSLKIKLNVGIDLANYRVVLNALRFTEVGKFNLKIEGSVGDKIRTFIVKLIMNLIRKHIVASIEKETVNTVSALVDNLNNQLHKDSRKFTFVYPSSARQLDVYALQFSD